MFYFGSWEGLVVGFFWSTVLLWQGTFVINSFTHIWGKRDFPSTDDSKNSMLFALITLGEGWHNNHHFYQASTRQGFFWWQIDITYYVIRLLCLFHIVWDIKEPPQRILEQRFKSRAEAEANPPACSLPRVHTASDESDGVIAISA
jgi:stearoyl-CoA desaturase (delta-9 desaturase)